MIPPDYELTPCRDPHRIDIQPGVSKALSLLINKALDNGAAATLDDRGDLVREAIRVTFPRAGDPFVPKRLDSGRIQPTFSVTENDDRAVKRLMAERDALYRKGMRDAKEKSTGDVVSECVRRYLVQHKEQWKLTDPDDLRALRIERAPWPPVSLAGLFVEHKLPDQLWQLLRRIFQRAEGPSTVPELLRLAWTSFNLPDVKPSDPLPSTLPSDEDFVGRVSELITINAIDWGLVVKKTDTTS